MPTDDAVAVWIDAYQPEIVSASVWDGALHDFVAGLVRELDVGLEASKRYGVFAVLPAPCNRHGPLPKAMIGRCTHQTTEVSQSRSKRFWVFSRWRLTTGSASRGGPTRGVVGMSLALPAGIRHSMFGGVRTRRVGRRIATGGSSV